VSKADNLPPSCTVVTKFGNLNFLEPSGPLRACNGTALPLPFTVCDIFDSIKKKTTEPMCAEVTPQRFEEF